MTGFDPNYMQHLGDFNDLANMYTHERRQRQEESVAQVVAKDAHDNHLLPSEYKGLLKDIATGETAAEAATHLHTLQVSNMRRFGFFSATNYDSFIAATPNEQTYKEFYDTFSSPYAGYRQNPPVFSERKFQSIYEKSRHDAQTLKKNVDAGLVPAANLAKLAASENMSVPAFMQYVTALSARPSSVTTKTPDESMHAVYDPLAHPLHYHATKLDMSRHERVADTFGLSVSEYDHLKRNVETKGLQSAAPARVSQEVMNVKTSDQPPPAGVATPPA